MLSVNLHRAFKEFQWHSFINPHAIKIFHNRFRSITALIPHASNLFPFFSEKSRQPISTLCCNEENPWLLNYFKAYPQWLGHPLGRGTRNHMLLRLLWLRRGCNLRNFHFAIRINVEFFISLVPHLQRTSIQANKQYSRQQLARHYYVARMNNVVRSRCNNMGGIIAQQKEEKKNRNLRTEFKWFCLSKSWRGWPTKLQIPRFLFADFIRSSLLTWINTIKSCFQNAIKMVSSINKNVNIEVTVQFYSSLFGPRAQIRTELKRQNKKITSIVQTSACQLLVQFWKCHTNCERAAVQS